MVAPLASMSPQLPSDPFAALHMRRCSVPMESKLVIEIIIEICGLSKQDLEIRAPLTDVDGDILPFLTTYFVVDSYPSTVTTSASATNGTNEISTDLPASSNPFLRSCSR
ncbi:hypothetical protein B296_00054239 [Ensete ventricosum]|uniref:Uncharacterized protein n=1 Tax=Ensete ventricosum TaxID=4639 RepID=A0A426XNR4_ENSVE|nr:hypothetical protein B296_00054239 [Ensete ventricosum]